MDVDGVLDVSGGSANAIGGDISVTGEAVNIGDMAVINATGVGGGGTVLLGGDYQGGGDLETATTTTVAAGASIDASATDNGDGGKVIVWGDDSTLFEGTIVANGGSAGGDGGFVEVSALDVLQFYGEVFASAPSGRPGTLLIDPEDIVITPFGRADTNGSAIQGETLSRLLRNGMHVELIASNSITIRDVIDGRALEGSTAQSGAMLVLDAGNNISIQDGFGAVTNGGDIRLSAGAGGISMGVDAYLVVADGGIAGGDLSSGVGNVVIDAGGDVSLNQVVSLGRVAIRSRSGSVTFNQSLYGAEGETAGVGGLLVQAAGDVNLRGVATTVTPESTGDLVWGDGAAVGAEFSAGDVRIESTSGAVTLADASEGDPTAVTAARNLVLEAVGTVSIGSQGEGATASLVAGNESDGPALLEIQTTGIVQLDGSLLNQSNSAEAKGIHIGTERAVASISTGTDVVIQANGSSGAENSAEIRIVSSGAVTTGDLISNDASDVTVTGDSVSVGTIAAPSESLDVPGVVRDISLTATNQMGSGISVDALLAESNVTLDSMTALAAGPVASNSGNVLISADGIVTLSGDVSAAAGTIVIGDADTNSRVGSLAAEGQLLSAGGAVSIASEGDVTVGRIDAVGSVEVDAGLATVSTSAARVTIAGLDNENPAVYVRSGTPTDLSVSLYASGDVSIGGDIYSERGSIAIGADNRRVGGTVTTEGIFVCDDISADVCGAPTAATADVFVVALDAISLERIVNSGTVILDTTSNGVTVVEDIVGYADSGISNPSDPGQQATSGVGRVEIRAGSGDISTAGIQTTGGTSANSVHLSAESGAVIASGNIFSDGMVNVTSGTNSNGIGLTSGVIQAVDDISIATGGDVEIASNGLFDGPAVVSSTAGSVKISQSEGSRLEIVGGVTALNEDGDVTITSSSDSSVLLAGIGARRNVVVASGGAVLIGAPIVGRITDGTEPPGVEGSISVSSDVGLEIWGGTASGESDVGYGVQLVAPLISIMGPLQSRTGDILLGASQEGSAEGEVVRDSRISLNHNIQTAGGDVSFFGDVTLFGGRLNQATDGFCRSLLFSTACDLWKSRSECNRAIRAFWIVRSRCSARLRHFSPFHHGRS